MTAALRRRWFLLVLAAGLTLALTRPDLLGPAARRLPPLAIVAGALFLVSISLEGRSIGRAVLRPLPALWALAISYGAVPALAWLAGRLLPLADLRVGLMIYASVPCTLATAVLWTRMAGGNEATALLVVLAGTASSWLVTTAWLLATTGARIRLDAAAMMGELFAVLILPVALGQLLRTIRPFARAADRHKWAIGAAGQLLIVAIILKAAVQLRTRLDTQAGGLGGALLLTGLVSAGVHLTALAAGLWSSRWLGFDRPSGVAVAFACSQKTLPVALYLLETHFQAMPLAVVPMVFYHASQMVADTLIAERWATERGGEAVAPAEVVI